MTDLGTLGGAWSQAHGINERSQNVGESNRGEVPRTPSSGSERDVSPRWRVRERSSSCVLSASGRVLRLLESMLSRPVGAGCPNPLGRS